MKDELKTFYNKFYFNFWKRKREENKSGSKTVCMANINFFSVCAQQQSTATVFAMEKEKKRNGKRFSDSQN